MLSPCAPKWRASMAASCLFCQEAAVEGVRVIDFQTEQCALCSIKFHATSVELDLNWLDRLAFSDGDTYIWKKVTCWPLMYSA